MSKKQRRNKRIRSAAGSNRAGQTRTDRGIVKKFGLLVTSANPKVKHLQLYSNAYASSNRRTLCGKVGFLRDMSEENLPQCSECTKRNDADRALVAAMRVVRARHPWDRTLPSDSVRNAVLAHLEAGRRP